MRQRKLERKVQAAMARDEWVELAQLAKLGGADIRDKTHSKTPLHCAAFKGKTALAAILLDNGADVGAQTTLGATPLHAAVRGDRAQMVKYLVERGADVDEADNELSTALHSASWRGNEECVKVLLGLCGANPHAKNARGERPIDVVRDSSKSAGIRKMLTSAMCPESSEISVSTGSPSAEWSSSSAASDISTPLVAANAARAVAGVGPLVP